MSAPVDVLAVMHDCAIALANEDACGHAAELTDARAAVAELIEADKEYDAAIAALDAVDPYSVEELFLAATSRLDAAKARRAAALARVTGGAS